MREATSLSNPCKKNKDHRKAAAICSSLPFTKKRTLDMKIMNKFEKRGGLWLDWNITENR